MVESRSFDKECSPHFIKPFHLVLLALAIKKHDVSCVDLSDEIKNYATRMHLWDAAGLEPPYEINEFDRSRSLVPVQAIKRMEDIDQVSKAFQVIAKHHYDEDAPNDFGTVISELLDNCYRHAERSKDLYGLACVQAWEHGNKGQLCIADTGVGIRNALSQNENYFDRLAHSNACEMAVEYGISGKLGKGHSGYGLALTKGIVDLNKGSLFVISGREGYQSKAGFQKRFNLESEWNGTLIILEWNLNQPLDSGPVYESWPSEDENDEFDDLF
jgi:anti-sigma regulatory factor (Ser/Thr protein kinase)